MWPNYRISLVGYHCSIEFPCGVPLFYCFKYPTLYTRICAQSCVRCILRTSYCSPLLFPLLLDLNFFRHLPLDLCTFFNRGHLLTITANRGPIVPLCYKSSVYPLDTLTHTHTHPTLQIEFVGYHHCPPISLFFRISLQGYTETKTDLWGTIVPIQKVPHKWPHVRPHWNTSTSHSVSNNGVLYCCPRLPRLWFTI